MEAQMAGLTRTRPRPTVHSHDVRPGETLGRKERWAEAKRGQAGGRAGNLDLQNLTNVRLWKRTDKCGRQARVVGVGTEES